MLVDAPVRMLLAQRLDQARVPAGMYHAKASGIDEQRQLVEPAEKVVPVVGVVGELGQCLFDQPRMARVVLAHELLAAAR
ncbi:hypothetical protein D3C77_644660 [compost metagenome]